MGDVITHIGADIFAFITQLEDRLNSMSDDQTLTLSVTRAIISGSYLFDRQRHHLNNGSNSQFKPQHSIRRARMSATADHPMRQIYERVLPSVVVISSEEGSGTGVIVDNTGLIVTNSHVVKDQAYVYIHLRQAFTQSELMYGHTDDNDRVTALRGRVMYCKANCDLALIRVHVKPGLLSTLTIDDHVVPKLGEPVLAIGNPDNIIFSYCVGVITGVDRRGSICLGTEMYYQCTTDADNRYIVHSAPIIHGFSGGPLLDSSGNLIGINFSGQYSDRTAIHASDVKQFIERGLKYEKQLNEKSRKSLGVLLEKQSDNSFEVINIGFDNPLNQNTLTGLQLNNIITAIGALPMTDICQLKDHLNGMIDGQTLTLSVTRNGEEIVVSLKPFTGDRHKCSSF
ncbi:unnamed protein product, partial [Medioppia subpectinata]